MTTYVIANDANGTFNIPAGSINTSLTSLALVGRGAPTGYGQALAQNTLSQLCNFASPNAPSNPLIGQLWYNSGTSTLEMYTGNSQWGQLASQSWVSANYASASAVADMQGSYATQEWVTSNFASASAVTALQEAASSYATQSWVTGTFATSQTVQNLQEQVDVIQSSSANITGALGSLETPGASGTIPMVNSDGSSYIFVSGAMLNTQTNVPAADDQYALGSSAARFSSVYAVTFNGTATSAMYADLAERYETDCELEPGDIVMLGGAKEITKTKTAFSTDVFGVVSTSPAYMMNSDAGGDDTHPYIALTGRVPAKVVGPVKKGQRLVSSDIEGVAVAVDLSDITSSFVVIGRALENKDTDGIGLVEIAVGAK